VTGGRKYGAGIDIALFSALEATRAGGPKLPKSMRAPCAYFLKAKW